jgi:hypothetical protein
MFVGFEETTLDELRLLVDEFAATIRLGRLALITRLITQLWQTNDARSNLISTSLPAQGAM